MNDAEKKWNEFHPEITYQRACEIEGVSDCPRRSAAWFNFEKLTKEEKIKTILEAEKQLKEAKEETKKQYYQGHLSVKNLKGTDFEGRGMDDHKTALRIQKNKEKSLKRLKDLWKQDPASLENL